MKKNIIILALVLMSVNLIGQKVTLESDYRDSAISIQKTEISFSQFSLRYDYKSSGADVLGIKVPKILPNWGALLLKIGDGGPTDYFVADSWYNLKLDSFNALYLEAGTMMSEKMSRVDYLGSRFSSKFFAAEAYALKDVSQANAKPYYWLAYHREKFFLSLGVNDKQYWGFYGTKNKTNFGNFSFINYNPKNGNFWFRSQSAWGNVNQAFFSQDSYLEATSYLVVPAFYYKHFSPIASKGDLAFKVDGKRVGKLQNYEVVLSKKIGNDKLRLTAGLTSEYLQDIKLAPVLEAYKSWKNNSGQLIVELRYDFLYKVASAYLTVRY